MVILIWDKKFNFIIIYKYNDWKYIQKAWFEPRNLAHLQTEYED